MKSSMFAGVLATLAASTTVFAQEFNQTGPFLLKISAPNNETLDGRYLYSCHAGASTQTLCVGTAEPPPNMRTAAYYYNFTVENDVPSASGILIYNLPFVEMGSGQIRTWPQVMSLRFDPASNVASTLFQVCLFFIRHLHSFITLWAFT